MSNINCLAGVACPKCSNEHCFKIMAVALATVTDNGAEVTGDMDWGDRSFTRCAQCGHSGMLREFQATAPDKSTPRTNPPPDPECMNDKRAAWAAAAILTFRQETETEYEDSLSDLLADLMHWADRHNFDFEAALTRASDHYQAETMGEVA